MRFCSTAASVIPATILAAFAMLFAFSAQALNDYGDFDGTTVTFESVRDQNGLYGSPTVSADSLDFDPSTFESLCPGGATCPPSPNIVDDTLNMFIQAKPGYMIDTLVLTEAGDTTLSSFLDSIAATSVAATVFIDVFEIDGIGINQFDFQTQMIFTNGGEFETFDEGAGTYLWTGFLAVDLDAVLADNGITEGHATRIGLSLNNTLTAFAQDGASARIEKKDIDGLAITIVPEPGTALLFGLGLAGLASARRSRMD